MSTVSAPGWEVFQHKVSYTTKQPERVLVKGHSHCNDPVTRPNAHEHISNPLRDRTREDAPIRFHG